MEHYLSNTFRTLDCKKIPVKLLQAFFYNFLEGSKLQHHYKSYCPDAENKHLVKEMIFRL